MPLSRRRLFQLGLAGTALLATGGALRWVALGYRLLPGEAAIGLSVKELAVVRAVVDTLLPEVDGFPSGVALGVHQRIDEEVWAAPDDLRFELRAAIQLVEHLPPVLGFPGRFSSLSHAQREACFQRLLASERDVFAQVALALKQLSHLFYYVREESWGPIHYDGPWVPVPRPPDSALRYQELLAAARRAA